MSEPSEQNHEQEESNETAVPPSDSASDSATHDHMNNAPETDAGEQTAEASLDLVQSIVGQGEEYKLTADLIDQILGKSHEAVQEGLFVAAVPDSYDLDLLKALRTREDGKDEKMLGRLRKFSFVIASWHDEQDRVIGLNRQILNERFISQNKAAYIATHRRAYDYYEANPHENESVHLQRLLYHGLIADSQAESPENLASVNLLLNTFRAYSNERQKAALEQLLKTAEDADSYLARLDTPWRSAYTDLRIYLHARFSQIEGNWADTIPVLQALKEKSNLWPSFKPFVGHSYANALANNEEFEAAITEYQISLRELETVSDQLTGPVDDPARKAIEAEKGTIMIALGDAYAGLAISARGYQEQTFDHRPGQRLFDWFESLLSLPLIIYLFFHFGWRVLRPSYWIALKGEDWIIVRLFTQSAQWYRRADPLLEKYGSINEGVAADERLAYLMLEMHDLPEASRIFDHLLAEREAPLGQYRRASVQVGQAETVLRQNLPGRAFILLQSALPTLEQYEDHYLQARAHSLMGQAVYLMGDSAESLTHYQTAHQLYRTTDRLVQATEVVEKLQDLVKYGKLNREQKEQIYSEIDPVTERQYPIKFEHPFLNTFRQLLLVTLILVLFFVPISAIDFSTTTSLSPNISFKPAPLLDIDGPININLQEGFDETGSAQAQISTDITILFEAAAGFVLGYIILTLGIGLAVIRFTSLKTVQAQSDTGRVYLSSTGLQVGRDGEQIAWSDIAHLHTANFWRSFSPIPLTRSQFGVITHDGKRLAISGRTSWYSSLLEQVELNLPEGVEESDNSVVMLKQAWLWLFLVGAVLMWTFTLNSAASTWLAQSISPRITYRGTDIYPYLYLLMFLPMLWWGIIRPWRTKRILEPNRFWPWGLFLAGIVLILLIVITKSRPLITVPDVYTPLLTITLLCTGGLFIWQDSTHFQLGQRHSIRILVALAALSGTLLAGGLMVRNVLAYDNFARGNHFSQTGIEDTNDQLSRIQYASALNSYQGAIDVVQFPLYFSEYDALKIDFGIPERDSMVAIAAVRARGSMYAQLGQYDLAVEDYESILPITHHSALVHSWIGISKQNLAHEDGFDFTEEEENELYREAVAHYTDAILVAPANARFYLWRAVAYHALEDLEAAHEDYEQAITVSRRDAGISLVAEERAQAFIGLGWIDFTTGAYEDSLVHFVQAVDADPELVDGYLGRAYAEYALKLYNLADRSASVAHELEPKHALPLIALGNIAWRQGGLTVDPDSGGQSVCDSTVDATDEERELAAAYWADAVDYFTQSVEQIDQNNRDRAYTYRTRGQIDWLLRNCPGHNKITQLDDAVESYALAVENAPDNAQYWQMHGRLGYALWLNSPRTAENDQILFQAYDSLWQSYILDNRNNTGTEHWLFDSVDPSIRDIAGSEAVDSYIAEVQAGADVTIADFADSCTHAFRWVSDITIPDDTVFAPETPFTKTWQIRNTGSCDWERGLQWNFVEGDQLDGESVTLPAVERGELVEVSVELVAPEEEGQYQSDWSMTGPDGEPVDNSTFVRILVDEEQGITNEDDIVEEEACSYQTAFIEDVTIPDDTEIKPGETFEKIWRIRNASTCAWDSSVRWVYKRGDQLGDTVAIPMPTTDIDEAADLAVTLVAPAEPGSYRSYWALQAPDGTVLSNSYYVQIVVPEEEDIDIDEASEIDEELGDTDTGQNFASPSPTPPANNDNDGERPENNDGEPGPENRDDPNPPGGPDRADPLDGAPTGVDSANDYKPEG